MSVEKNYLPSNCYSENKLRVFEIYGIDPDDTRYNCHHLVTRNDFKSGNINPNFEINSKSNLYPMRTRLHTILNLIIDATDNNEDIQPLLLRYQKTEEFLIAQEKCPSIAERLPPEIVEKLTDNFPPDIPKLEPCYQGV